MGNHHDSIALDWVRGEIQDTLTQSQHALEAYVENRDDNARLRFCLNYLHQVHGTLKMVELDGAALLTEEMEALTQALLDGQVANTDDAIEVLMQGVLQLPQYLEHLGSSGDDFPLVLLPLLNDLRAARGENLLSDTALFQPDLSPAQIPVNTSAANRLQDPKVAGHLRKLRQMYQFALAGVVREADLNTHFDYMQKVIERLARLCRKTPRGELWKAAGAFVETLQAHANPVNSAVKSLLRELDAEIRLLMLDNSTALQQPLPDALFKHLLYYVARARDLDLDRDLPQVKAVRDAYQLDDALPSDDDVSSARTRVSGPGRDAIHSVVTALNEELAQLKDQLDLFVRAEFRQNDELEELLPALRQVANTLGVIGLGTPRKVISEQVELLEKLSSQAETVDDGTLMDIAGALLYVESSLAGLDKDRHPSQSAFEGNNDDIDLGARQLTDASEALLRESRNTLEQVKSSIVNFIASQWDTREIDHVPGLLHSIRGGLSLVPLERVPDMLAAAERYVSDVLLGSKQVPDWKQLDTLADAITSIEYYLERLSEGINNNDAILHVAEDSLQSLGFPVGQEPTWTHTGESSTDTTEAEPPAPAEPAPETSGSDQELLDDDILAIFVEEAGEVLETIHQHYPLWRQNHDDSQALTEVRRAFHTLKGSGRLVGAGSIGELAWAVENLLNRIIDQSIKPADEVFTLIDEVNARIPSLIQDFRHGEANGDVDTLIERAEALATTRKTEAPADATPEPEPRPVSETTPETGADDLIDDDILEIFIEEAGEVLETIREYLPMLLRQHDNRSALTEVRRAFHTLKGSGRMVGASVIGELAWSIENMLNRVIDGSIFMNDDIAQLLEEVTQATPGLVEDFENRRPARLDTSNLEARAKALANGEIPDATLMPAPEPDAVTASDTTATPGEQEPTGELPKQDGADEEIDPVLLDIFENETETHLQTIETYLADAGERSSVAYTDSLSRALHTLKGSANTAGITPIATVITPLERFIKEARAQGKRADQPVLALIAEARDFLSRGLAQLHDNPQAPLAGTEDFLARLDSVSNQTLLTQPQADSGPARNQDSARLVQLFLGEGLDIVLDAESILDDWSRNPGQRGSVDTLHRELEQLNQGAAEAGLTDVARLASALDRAYSAVAERDVTPDQSFFTRVHDGHEQLINLMDQVAAGLATDTNDELIEQLDELARTIAQPEPEPEPAESAQPESSETSENQEVDDELLAIFLEEARELVDSTAQALQDWSDNTANLDILHLLQRDLHTLKGGARLADIPALGDLSHELENLFEGLTEQRFTINDTLSDLLFRCHDRLAGMVDSLETGEPPRPAPDLISDIHAYIDDTGDTATTTEQAPLPTSEPAPEPKTPEQTQSASAPQGETFELADFEDDALAEMFLDEGREIHQTITDHLEHWRHEPDALSAINPLLQELQVLKSGARLSDVDAIADLAQTWADALNQLVEGERDRKPLLALSGQAESTLKTMLDTLEQGTKPAPATELMAALQVAHDAEPEIPASESETPTTSSAKTPAQPAAKPKPAKSMSRGGNKAGKNQNTAQETIRVSAPLLDELVNLAGETSITRGRLEQQSSDFGYTLDEMASTIERLREQLRRMDIETEAQILFRAEQEHGPNYGDDFDPLEMDRYSSIQQLSRALSESTSDLADLRETLSDSVRDTETLLVQQSRINTELQEGLMKTRMIPFTSMVPRLRRIVRQISGELHKKVHFDIRNAEGEMDRNILERMVAPLEHMLRNAVDHGIENPAERKQAGKKETGEIALSLSREGGDVVLRMADDGKGIPVDVIRDKAIRQGLMEPNEELSRREILQFILQAGFSTAREVTQISGRGVGLDVVASELKQLGGSLDIDATEGKGTVFTVRLPFTVSVNRALMVATGEDFYAIPLNTIEGIVRVSTYELEEYYKPDAPLYEYAGQQYRLQYLGGLLDSDHQPKLQGQALPLPVILVRGADQPVALQVDHLMGSREIVVKSLGPQFNSVRGVSGGTILGDGSVVVILDLPAMLRSDALAESQRLANLEKAKESTRYRQQVTTVMVVDDSVTVRKVTSRLLERNGMDVFTAKDGVDAVAQLQDHRPDVILLDIEMPRMDGFEVASFIRHDEKLLNTPICMITSRTGEKHRERALAIGVNEYLGKPFQETDLLATIKRLTGSE